MGEITRALIARVGVDLAKRVIQVHAVDATGRVVVSRALKRAQFVAWWAAAAARVPDRDGGVFECAPLGAQTAIDGVRCEADRGELREPVSHGRQRGKNDATDAAAICE